MRRFARWILLLLLAFSSLAFSQSRPQVTAAEVDAIYPDIEKIYLDLHQSPELSAQEFQTARKMADGLRALGFEVTTGVGGTGVVGVLRNGPGPVVALRTELDALPVEEKTGLPYASRVRVKNASGQEVGVMHACGHDVHMASWLGTARLMAANRSRWSGTLIMIGQPAEETVGGARGMLDAGLYTRFPKPDYVLAVHDEANLAAGQVDVVSGIATSNADSVDITIYGRGGHGARPQDTIDPIVIAARVVLTLQTLISREKSPFAPAVVTVGSIHGGSKNNIIPDEVKLQLTVRSFDAEVRKHLLDGIRRVARGEAEAAGAEKPPLVEVTESVTSIYNDPALTARVRTALRARLGEANVHDAGPRSSSEDFSEYESGGVPVLQFFVGAANPAALAEAQRAGRTLPPLHSALFAPDREPTIKTAITAEVTALLELMGRN